MRIAVIGGAGFMGRALSAFLARKGHRVRVVDAPQRLSDLAEHDFETFETGATQITPASPVFEHIDAVVFLASTSGPQTSMSDIERDASENVLSAIRTIEGCRAHAIDLFLFSSSGGTIYGEPADEIVSETHPTSPITAYGAAKLAIEKYMAVYALQYGLRTISLRIANAYGPGQLGGASVGVIANFLRRVRDREPLEIWGDGSAVRDYVYIDDIVDAFDRCLSTPGIPAGEYNVGSGIGHSVNQVVEEIRQVTGATFTVRHRAARTVDVRRAVLDCRKLRQAVGWRPQVTLRSGIDRIWKAAVS